MSHNLLITCTYTPGTPYEEEARDMAASAARFGYRAEPMAVPDQGDWWRNCGIKPSCFLRAFQEHEGPTLWLDADCLILQPLDELLTLLQHADMAIKYRPGHSFSALFNTGVILLRKSPATLSLVADWAELSIRHGPLHRFPDQATFSEAVLRHQRQVRITPLAERFHMFAQGPDLPPPAECVIFHNKMSRRIRNSALPKVTPSAPKVQVPSPVPNVRFLSLGPQAPPSQGLPMNGVAGANREWGEFASRWGIADVLYVGLPTGEHDLPALEATRLAVLRGLCRQLPPDSLLVLADYDVVFLRDPRRFAEPLAAGADLVLAWDHEHTAALPSTRVMGLRLGKSVRDDLLPQAEAVYARLIQQFGPQVTPATALAQVLRSHPHLVSLTCLPSRSVSDLAQATRATVAVAVRGELSCLPGIGPPHWPLIPAALQATSIRHALTD
jgi:hypothetical protein